MTTNNLQLVDRWMVRLPGPHKERSHLDEYWLERMDRIVVDGFGEFFQTEDIEPTLGWTWYEDRQVLTLGPLDMLVERRGSSPYRFLDLHAAISQDRLLFADESSCTVWSAGRTEARQTGARLDRPSALDPGLRFMKFQASPSGRWVVVFVESGFAAFEAFELKMVEQYDELLWRPADVTETEIRLDHYSLGERRITLLH